MRLFAKPSGRSAATPPPQRGYHVRMLLADEVRALRVLIQILVSPPWPDEIALEAEPHEGIVERHMLAPLCFRLGREVHRGQYVASVVASRERDAQWQQASGVLLRAGCGALPIKGMAYASTLYEDAALRPMSDIDVLVTPGGMRRALRALADIGYVVTGKLHGLSPAHHAIAVEHPDQALALDLHRSILPPARHRLRSRDVWRRARRDAAGRACALDPVDETLLHFAHLGRHEFLVPAVNYVDAALLWARCSEPQRDTLRRRAQATGLSRCVRVGLALLHALGDETQPTSAVTSWPAITCDDIVAGAHPERLTQLLRKLALLDAPRDAAGLLRSWVVAHLGSRRARGR